MSDINEIIEAQLKELREVSYKNKETTEELAANWDKDRKDFSQFESRLAHMEVEFKSLREIIHKLPRSVSEALVGVADQMSQEISEFKDVMVDKKVVAIDNYQVQHNKKRWWQFWRG